MSTLHFQEAILFILPHIALVFGQHSFKAEIINNCTDSTHSTSCIYTYVQVFQSLAKSDNSFNISYALYPGRLKPSSVRVFVNVYGPNKTENSTPGQYTWSMSCLYVAIPAVILEFFSLGSILVTPRTQVLNIQIPFFCCNVSTSEEERSNVIDGMLIRALSELQDLAVSPQLRDSRLNTAECVIQGHEPNIDATGMSPYIRPMLWCSFFSVLLIGPIIAFFVLDLLGNIPGQEDYVFCAKTLEEDEAKKENYVICNHKLIRYKRTEVAEIYSAKFLCNFLLPTEIVAIFLVIFYFANSVPGDIYVIPVIIVEGFVICIVQCCTKCCAKCDFCKEDRDISIYRRSSFIASSNLILYHFCWLIIGIMINPPWGLTVLLIVCFVGFAAFYSVKAIRDAENTIHPCLVYSAAFVGLCLTATLTVLAGQSFYGRETADDVIKTVLLFVVGKISWMYWKDRTTSANSTNPTGNKNKNVQSESDATDKVNPGRNSPPPRSSSKVKREGFEMNKKNSGNSDGDAENSGDDVAIGEEKGNLLRVQVHGAK